MLTREACKKTQQIQEVVSKSVDFRIKLSKNQEIIYENMGINQVSLQEISEEVDPDIITAELLNRYITPLETEESFTPSGSRLHELESRPISPPKRDLNIITIEELHKNYENLFTSEKPTIHDHSTENNFHQLNYSKNISSKQSESFSKSKILKGRSGKGSGRILSRNQTIDKTSKDMLTGDDSNIIHESFMSESRVPNLGEQVLMNEEYSPKNLSKNISNNISKGTNRMEDNGNGYMAPNTSHADNINNLPSNRFVSIRQSENSSKIQSNLSNKVDIQNLNIPLMQSGHLQALLPRTPRIMSENNSDSENEHLRRNIPEENINEGHQNRDIQIQNQFPEYISSSQEISDPNNNFNNYPHHGLNKSREMYDNPQHQYQQNQNIPNDTYLIESNNEPQESNLYNDIEDYSEENQLTKNIEILPATSIPNMY